MSQIKHILVPTDFSDCAQHALGHALLLARRFGAQLTMFHVVTVFDDDPYNPEKKFPDVQEYYKHLEGLAKRQLTQAVPEQKAEGIRIHYVVRRGFSAAEEVLQYAGENEVDLIAVGTHGRRALAHFLLGSVSERIIQRSKCPVLTSRITPTDFDLAEGYATIMVPTDFSGHSSRAVKFAASVCLPGGEIDILHVVDESIHPAYYASGQSSIFEIIPDLRRRTGEALQKFGTDNLEPEQKVQYALEEGQAAEKIVQHAERIGADLIVMGTRGLGDLEQILVGSVTERVIRRASMPVIVIK